MLETIRQKLNAPEYDQALILVEEALLEQPENLEFLCAKAEVLKKLNQFTKAVNQYIRILELYPDYKKAQVEKDLIHIVMLQENKDFFECTNLFDDPWE